MDRDLFLSVLSLDSYHRGYGPGLYFDRLGVSGSNIGLAQLDDAKGDLAAQSIGFFAQSYLWNGEKVISYRGTDNSVINPIGLDQDSGFPRLTITNQPELIITGNSSPKQHQLITAITS